MKEKTCKTCAYNIGRAGDYVNCKVRRAYYIEYYECSNWKEKGGKSNEKQEKKP